MSTPSKNTTLTLDDIQMIGEVVLDSERRLDKKITVLQQEIGGMKQEIGGMKHEIGGIKQEIGGIKHEIGGMKHEIGGMKQEIGGIKQEISGIKNEMVRKDEYVSLIKSAVTEVIEEKIKEIVGHFPNKNQFHTQMAIQAKTVEKVEQEQVVLTHQVQRIDNRVTKIEARAFT